MSMHKLFFLFFALFPLGAQSAVTTESLCFELRTYYDEASKWSGGFVKYAKSSEPISIVLTDSQNEILDPDAPW
ncbi:hypothetical protein [Pseudomonas sp. MD195_PC81_125]|uniref:hypothetical protein n=1 Tax=Pseudomonas sp. MD195_PC81_125 TaxID=2741560 RepID=UPI00274166FE|nr:hypothetical protein [Pseudomonas sp. MD195_PC81_125]